MSATFSVTLGPVPAPADLAAEWRVLEARADGSFFTSWTWIGAWLELILAAGLQADLVLVRARHGEDTVGLGILCRAKGGWRSFGRRYFLLHQTGQPALDTMYIEYNDFLLATEVAIQARTACLNAIGLRPGLQVNAARPPLAEALAAAALPYRVFRSEVCSVADLTRMGDGTGLEGVLAALSRNSRHQIGRAVRLAESDGTLQIDRAPNLETATQWLSMLIELHTAAWTARKALPGAFASTQMLRFIVSLIAMGTECGSVDILRIGQPERPLGFLLNFVHDDEVYAYQSGFAYGEDNRLKPGLVCHALALAYYKARGCRAYHFMAGASRYKQSLSNAQETLLWVESRPKDLLFHAENLCQRVWRAIRR